jgi:hypothetical protein
MSEITSPDVPKPRNPLLTAVIVACGVIALVVGLVQVMRGVVEMLGSKLGPEVEALLSEANQASLEGLEDMKAAMEPFNDLMKDADTLGLPAFRAERRAAADKVTEHFAGAADQYRLAARKLDEVLTYDIKEEFRPYFAAKGRAFILWAETCELNRDIVHAVLDESLATTTELNPKIQSLAERRDAKQKEAEQATAEADAMMKDQ